MKKLLSILVLATLTTSLSAQSKWNIGISTGCVTNVAKFDGGDEQANALFSNNPYKSNNIAVNFRYKICDRLSFQSGMGITRIGFSYSIAEDYSLLKPFSCKDDIHSQTVMTEIPAMLVLNTPVNCNNVRFIFGAGFAVRGIDNSWDNQAQGEIQSYEASNTENTFITSQSRTTTFISPAATWMIGMERVMKRGNTLSFTFRGNQGFTTVMKSNVDYTVNNKDYSHSFINRGSFVTFSLAYNFSPFGSRKAVVN
jgi:hypothetical protein